MLPRASLLLPLFSLLAVTGCRAQAIDDHAEREIASIHEDSRSLFVAASCPDGVVLHAECGLVTQRVAMPDFRKSFAEKKCASDTTEVCQEKFDTSVTAWLTQRYPLADAAAVEATCAATPGRCDNPTNYELLLSQSHNDAVAGLDSRRRNAALERRDEQLAMDYVDTRDAAFATMVGVGIFLTTPHYHRHYRW